jgi:hypothetical protein
MTSNRCDEYTRLQMDVNTILEKLRQITQDQLQAFRSKDEGTFMRLDKELELTLGEKERSIGALRQHVQEHKCQEA